MQNITKIYLTLYFQVKVFSISTFKEKIIA